MTLPAIADAVTAYLNDAAWNTGELEFTASRVYLPDKDLVSLASTQLQVLVFAGSDEVSVLSRDDQLEEPRICVAVIQKLAPTIDPTSTSGNAAIDPLVNLCRQIALAFGPGTYLDSLTGTQWVESKYAPIFDAPLMLTGRTFLAVVNFKFQQTG